MGEARELENSKLTPHSGLTARRTVVSPTEQGRWREQGGGGVLFEKTGKHTHTKCPGALGKGGELNTRVNSRTLSKSY